MASKREKSQPPDKQRGALERSGTEVLTWGSGRSARDGASSRKERRLQHRCGPWPCPSPLCPRVPCPLRFLATTTKAPTLDQACGPYCPVLDNLCGMAYCSILQMREKLCQDGAVTWGRPHSGWWSQSLNQEVTSPRDHASPFALANHFLATAFLRGR